MLLLFRYRRYFGFVTAFFYLSRPEAFYWNVFRDETVRTITENLGVAPKDRTRHLLLVWQKRLCWATRKTYILYIFRDDINTLNLRIYGLKIIVDDNVVRGDKLLDANLCCIYLYYICSILFVCFPLKILKNSQVLCSCYVLYHYKQQNLFYIIITYI